MFNISDSYTYFLNHDRMQTMCDINLSRYYLLLTNDLSSGRVNQVWLWKTHTTPNYRIDRQKNFLDHNIESEQQETKHHVRWWYTVKRDSTTNENFATSYKSFLKIYQRKKAFVTGCIISNVIFVYSAILFTVYPLGHP